MSNETPKCPYCKTTARLVLRPVRVKRGDRVLSVDLETWECVTGCAAPDGPPPFRFVEQVVAHRNTERVRERWLAEFGEPLPEARRPGRKPPERRSVPVHVLLTPSEARELDRLRGEESRSEYIRSHVLTPTRRSA